MTSKEVWARLDGSEFNQLKGVIRNLIDGFGGCAEFLDANTADITRMYNAQHPPKPGKEARGAGKKIFLAVDFAKTIIRGVDDDSRLMKKSEEIRHEAEEATRAKCFEEAKDALMSEPIVLSKMADAITWLQQIETEDTLGAIIAAYDKICAKDKPHV